MFSEITSKIPGTSTHCLFGRGRGRGGRKCSGLVSLVPGCFPEPELC